MPIKPLPKALIAEILTAFDNYYSSYLVTLNWCQENSSIPSEKRELHQEYNDFSRKENLLKETLESLMESILSEYSWLNPFYIWQSKEAAAKMIQDRWNEACADECRAEIQVKYGELLKPIKENLLYSSKIYDAKNLEVGKWYLDLTETPILVTRKTPKGKTAYSGDVKLKNGYSGGYLDSGKGYKEMSAADAKIWADILFEFRAAVQQKKSLLELTLEPNESNLKP